MIERIDPPLPIETPKGKAMAHFLIDMGMEHSLLWVCFIDETRQCWTYRNEDILIQHNETMRPQR